MLVQGHEKIVTTNTASAFGGEICNQGVYFIFLEGERILFLTALCDVHNPGKARQCFF
jgi:hypothetical protein